MSGQTSWVEGGVGFPATSCFDKVHSPELLYSTYAGICSSRLCGVRYLCVVLKSVVENLSHTPRAASAA
jgi:hypothetical protein